DAARPGGGSARRLLPGDLARQHGRRGGAYPHASRPAGSAAKGLETGLLKRRRKKSARHVADRPRGSSLRHECSQRRVPMNIQTPIETSFPADRELVIERVFDAPREKIYQA